MKVLFTKFSEFIGIVILMAIFSIVFTYPSISLFTSSFIGDGWDNYEYAGYIGLAARNISEGNFPFIHTDFWRYPAGFDFGRGFDSYITVLVGTLFRQFFNLVISYNLTVFSILIFNGIASYYFFKKIVNSKWLGILGAIIYGFSFYAIAKAASHPNLLTVGTLPLLGITVLRIFRHETLSFKDFLIFFVALILVSLGSTQYFIMVLLMGLLLLPIWFFVYKEEAKKTLRKVLNSKKAAIFAFIIAATLLATFYFQHLVALLSNEFVLSKRAEVLTLSTPSITDYVLPNKYLSLVISKVATSLSAPSIEKVIFLGWIELVFVLMFFVSKVPKALKAFIGLSLLIPFLLSLGYGTDNNFSLLPYRALGTILPFSLIVETGRYFVVIYLFVTIAVLSYLASIKSKTIFITLSCLILLGALFERIPTKFYTSDSLVHDKYIEIVRKTNTKAVMDFPLSVHYSPYDILSLYYDKPIVNGYFHWSANGIKENEFTLHDNLISRFVCVPTDKGFSDMLERKKNDQMRKLFKENGITTLVVHKDNKFYHPECTEVRARLSMMFPPTQVIEETPVGTYKEVHMKAETGKSQFQLYFPKKGVFSINGIYIVPSHKTHFVIYHNAIPVAFKKGKDFAGYSWDVGRDNSLTFNPTNTLSVEVNAGDTINFLADDKIDFAHFSLWYTYKSNGDSIVPYAPFYTKIYEDKKASVYTIN